ncbi:hypothetical protein [Eisenibacter elegans]|jgi:hypothetical protein|uniref:hypothetical protein n=1 Tax=Eisenibacter elegans TaxID=997 RepID=UPI0003F4C740|nr:hypothetical protein [Eisenibacter elegans]
MGTRQTRLKNIAFANRLSEFMGKPLHFVSKNGLTLYGRLEQHSLNDSGTTLLHIRDTYGRLHHKPLAEIWEVIATSPAKY